MEKGSRAGVKTRGVIIGKFMPPHRGHQYLIDFGAAYVDELVVMVCSIAREPIAGHIRYEWVRDSFPLVRVVHHSEEIPQEPHEHPDFWTIWRDAIWNRAGKPIDYVFASEDYGWKLAAVLEAEYIPVDHARSLVPICATRLREDCSTNWDFLLPSARPHFVKRVAIVGPESAGKTTMARQLAAHYQTVCVDEYARGLLNFNNGWCEEYHIPRIAMGQLASETALARQANRVLFSDTDVLTTTIWSRMLFGDCPPWIMERAQAQRFDLTLLLDCDLVWENDGQRYMPDLHERQKFFQTMNSELQHLGRHYAVIRGDGPERLAAAIRAIDKQLFGSKIRAVDSAAAP
jgi:NadR type nicotinamide-nucleotide adenylyltransferase